MAIDSELKRRACLSFARVFDFQGSEPGTLISDMADRVVMCFCYPFKVMAPPALNIQGIKWLGNKTWLADRKARSQKARGKMSKQQLRYRTDDEVEATARVRAVRARQDVATVIAYLHAYGRWGGDL